MADEERRRVRFLAFYHENYASWTRLPGRYDQVHISDGTVPGFSRDKVVPITYQSRTFFVSASSNTTFWRRRDEADTKQVRIWYDAVPEQSRKDPGETIRNVKYEFSACTMCDVRCKIQQSFSRLIPCASLRYLRPPKADCGWTTLAELKLSSIQKKPFLFIKTVKSRTEGRQARAE